MSREVSPSALYNDAHHSGPISPLLTPKSPVVNPTRTVAIIKPHALEHRFEIEQRISEANFEVVKERHMDFDVESDPDTLYELFGEDAACFAEGPVWVYVLERRRAIQVWNTLMGDPDPTVAAAQAPTSLRALYGLSPAQNAVMGSPDTETAEIQIASLFASSPPFPATDFAQPDDLSLHNLDLAASAAAARSPRNSESGTAASTANGSSSSPKHFRARNIPITHLVPSIAPRTSRAAALRAGLPVPTERGPRVPPTREELKQIFMDVPGHKRSESIAVASTAPPALAPRMTRAASLRLGQTPAPAPRRPSAGEKDRRATFDGVPGHKRRESIAVASTRTPAVAPKLNKSAALRAQKDSKPPSSYMFKGASTQRLPLSRQSSQTQLGARPVSAQGVSSPSRTGSGASSGPPSTTGVRSPTAIAPARPPSSAGGGRAPSSAAVRPASLQAPTVAPRQNKSAMLRAAKLAGTPTKSGKPVFV